MPEQFTFHEEVLALCLCDDDAAKHFANLLTDYAFPRDEQGVVCEALLKFTSQWGAAAKEHAYELVEPEYRPYLRELQELAGRVHRDYVMARLDQFMREGAIRKTALMAMDAIQMNDWDAVEAVYRSYSRKQTAFFNPGIRLKGDALRSILTQAEHETVYRTGVTALDAARVGPAPKTMFVLIAPAKRGKTWGLIHIGKTSCIDQLSVLHITLEMPERQIARRYVQSALALTKRQLDGVDTSLIQLDNLGRLQAITPNRVVRPRLDGAAFDKANALFSRWRLYVKEFPTGSLTTADLRAYLDTMETVAHVVPDVLILDYPDLMKINGERLRVDLGIIFKEVRGIAMERGIALVTATQTGRQSANARWVRDTDITEDYSKIMTADTVVSYSQTPEERKLGLARLFVTNARDEGDKWGAVITQAIAMGQFCLDSFRLFDDQSYWRLVDDRPEEAEE